MTEDYDPYALFKKYGSMSSEQYYAAQLYELRTSAQNLIQRVERMEAKLDKLIRLLEIRNDCTK